MFYANNNRFEAPEHKSLLNRSERVFYYLGTFHLMIDFSLMKSQVQVQVGCSFDEGIIRENSLITNQHTDTILVEFYNIVQLHRRGERKK